MKRGRMRILLIDNYDSFTYNLLHYLQISGAAVEVMRNDSLGVEDAAKVADALVISPGPSSPRNAGLSFRIVRRHLTDKPVLGVCLGMQIINEVLGGKTVKAPYPVHGKTCRISVDGGDDLFRGLPSQIQVARYHSLMCGEVPAELKLLAVYRTVPMAFRYGNLPVWGVQFHPESFLTPQGQKIINNFVETVHELAENTVSG